MNRIQGLILVLLLTIAVMLAIHTYSATQISRWLREKKFPVFTSATNLMLLRCHSHYSLIQYHSAFNIAILFFEERINCLNLRAFPNISSNGYISSDGNANSKLGKNTEIKVFRKFPIYNDERILS